MRLGSEQRTALVLAGDLDSAAFPAKSWHCVTYVTFPLYALSLAYLSSEWIGRSFSNS